METLGERRARRQQRHRLQAVTGTSIALVVVALILASCGGSESARAATAHSPNHWSLHARPLALERTAARLAETVTTTTTTRTAVSPEYGPPPENSGAGRRIVYCNSCQTV